MAPQPLTNWRAKDKHCQQARNTARHYSHSHPGEPRTGIVSRLETQQGTTATHFLESQGQALTVGQKHSKAPQPLTSWRANDRHCQQARNTARHYSHSLPGEPMTGIVSRLETQQGTTATHRLESQGTVIVSRLETQQSTTATHILESQGQALSAG